MLGSNLSESLFQSRVGRVRVFLPTWPLNPQDSDDAGFPRRRFLGFSWKFPPGCLHPTCMFKCAHMQAMTPGGHD